jgi:hypothetical protein
MEWLYADVRALKLSLDHAPEIFHRVRVYITIGVLDGVVNHGVPVVRRKTVVGLQRIAEQRATGLDVFLDVFMKFMLPATRNGERSNLSATVLPFRVQSLCPYRQCR